MDIYEYILGKKQSSSYTRKKEPASAGYLLLLQNENLVFHWN